MGVKVGDCDCATCGWTRGQKIKRRLTSCVSEAVAHRNVTRTHEHTHTHTHTHTCELDCALAKKNKMCKGVHTHTRVYTRGHT